jgi:hypothetical protein
VEIATLPVRDVAIKQVPLRAPGRAGLINGESGYRRDDDKGQWQGARKQAAPT